MKHFFFLLLVLCVSTKATAQDFYMPPLMGGDVAIGLAAQSHIQKSEEQRAQDGSASASADFTFSSDRSRTQKNLQNFVARTPDRAAQADLQTLFAAQPNIIAEIGVAIRSYGLDANNVADAYTVWWINSWLVSEMRNEDVDRATVQAVQSQARAALAQTPGLTRASEAERQEFAEALLLHGVLLDAAIDQAGTDPTMLRNLASSARRAAINSGLDLTTMALTQDGFVLR